MNEGIKLFLFLINGILYLACGGLWLLSPDAKTLNYTLTIFALAMTSILLYSGRNDLKTMEQSYIYRRWGYTTINLFLVLTILAFLNYLSFKNNAQLDLSETKINSLSSTSEMLIKGLKKNLDVKVFAKRDEARAIVSLLDLYKQHKSNMRIDVYDPETRPDLMRANEIDKENSVIMEYEKRKQYIKEHTELEYSNALRKLGRKRDPIIYHTVGHLEFDFKGPAPEEGGVIASALSRSLIHFKPVDLLAKNAVPTDADMLVVWGPKRAFFKPEIDALHDYLSRGGRLLLALDPAVVDDRVIELRKYFKRTWEIDIPNTIVVDRKNFVSGSNGSVPLIKNFELKHLLTKSFDGQVFFPLVSSVSKFETEQGRGKFVALAMTTPFPGSWIDFSPLEIVSGTLIYNSKQDQKGPASVVGIWEETTDTSESKPRTKIMAFGNSTFIQNQYAHMVDNFSFFLKSTNYLASDDELLTLNLAIKKNSPILIDDKQLKLVFYVSVIVLPVVLFILAFLFYRRRRA
ncbi:MAG: GldG family protein [Bdellovibrio sp.]|nr:GldG family protein [Bdellovibrio sp.]